MPALMATIGDEFAGVLSLADSLMASKAGPVRTLARLLYTALFRLYSDAASRERILRELVWRAAARPQALHPASSSSQPTSTPSTSGSGNAKRKAAAAAIAAAAAAAATAAAEAASAAESGVPSVDMVEARELLLWLAESQPGPARTALALTLDAAHAHQLQVAISSCPPSSPSTLPTSACCD